MEKKEVAVYLYLGVLIVASLLAIYFFNLQLTGFAVYQQNNQTAFNEGVYENVSYDANASAVILTTNQTSGVYTSKVFDANGSAIWNNLTWIGNGTLVFEVRSCFNIGCSNSSFSVANLNNLNLSGQYFQYRVLFDANSTSSLSSVLLDYSTIPSTPTQVSITLSEPSGQKSSTSNIPLKFNLVDGENYVCWYNIKDASDNAEITGATNLVGCNNNTTFNLGAGKGSYVFTLYVNSSLGLQNKTSSFSVNLGTSQTEEEEIESTVQVPVVTTPVVEETPDVTDLSLQAIEKSTINPSESRNYNLVATNAGNVPLSACKLSFGGNSSSWASTSDVGQNINAGEVKNFAFSVNVPKEAVEGSNSFSLSVQCAEILKNSEFSIDVVKKRVEFNVTDVKRTRQNRVVVTYSLDELLDEEQVVQLQFFLYNAANQEVGNATTNQTLSAGESNKFNTNLVVNESLEGNLTLSASLNSQQYSVSVREPIVLGSPTGFFLLGDNLGTTGNILAIVILLGGLVVIYIFFLRRKVNSKN